MTKLKYKAFLIFFFYFTNQKVYSNDLNLASYQSLYEISLDKDRKIESPLGQPSIKKANGELLIDWFDNCTSWVSNQRMLINFTNSNGVGTVSDINYSLNEAYNSDNMSFALQVKQNNEIVEQFRGSGERNDTTLIKLFNPKEENLEFSSEIIFPHGHLKKIIQHLGNLSGIVSYKVYEGSIPKNYLNISSFINKESKKEKFNFPSGIENKFWSVRMAYYEGETNTPQLELTAKINRQGIVSSFQYDYPEYSLSMKLKKIELRTIKCD
tara:strand:+ start:41 stop:844 length:804 start_codon:yes stop_codon:yes gene_type:complete